MLAIIRLGINNVLNIENHSCPSILSFKPILSWFLGESTTVDSSKNKKSQSTPCPHTSQTLGFLVHSLNWREPKESYAAVLLLFGQEVDEFSGNGVYNDCCDRSGD